MKSGSLVWAFIILTEMDIDMGLGAWSPCLTGNIFQILGDLNDFQNDVSRAINCVF